MSAQHAQAYIAELYDYSAAHWSTAASAYAHGYLEYRVGRREEQPQPRTVAGLVPGVDRPFRPEQIRECVDRELAR